MERKNLPVSTKKRGLNEKEVIYIKPSDIKKIDSKFEETYKLEKLKIKGRQKTLDKQNIGKGIDFFNNVIDLAKQVVEYKAQNKHSEDVLKELDKKMDLIDKEAEKFVRSEREKRETLIIKHKIIRDKVDDIVSIANSESLSEEIKIITIEAISKAAAK